MKKINKLVLLALSTVVLLGCDKGTEPLSKQEKNTAVASSNSFRTEVYYEPLEVLDELDKTLEISEDALRSSLLSKRGTYVPELKWETGNDTKVFWGLEGVGTLTNISKISTAPAAGSNFNNNFLLTNNNKNIQFYVSTNAQTTGKKTCLSIGGVANGTKIFVKPNEHIQAILRGEEDKQRDIPLMTDLTDFNKVFAGIQTSGSTTPRVKIKPRGCLVGINLINKLGRDVTLNKIIFETGGALSYEGTFDLVNADSNNKARFASTSDNFILDGLALSCASTTDAVNTAKETAPILYIWGMPTNPSAKMKVKFVFTINIGGTDTQLTTTTINLPAGFEEQKAYRRAVILEVSKIFKGKTALDYVADYPVNKTAERLVTHHNRHSINYLGESWADTETGFHALSNWIKNDLFQRPELTAYKLASKNEWASIVNNNTNGGFIISFKGDVAKQDLPENVMIGNDNVSGGSEYQTINGVTYALRFKGTKWQSAWRYAWQDSEPKGMNIKCIPLTNLSNLSIDKVAKEAFFNDSLLPISEKHFSAYGCVRQVNTAQHIDDKDYGIYWSSTDPWHLFFSKDAGAGLGDQFHPVADKMTIRPFYKTLP